MTVVLELVLELETVLDEQLFCEVEDLIVPPSVLGFAVLWAGLTTYFKGSGVKRSLISSGLGAGLRRRDVLFRSAVRQLRESEFGFEAGLGVLLSDFLLSST